MKLVIHTFRTLSLSMCIACFFISHSCSDPGSTGQIEIDACASIAADGQQVFITVISHDTVNTRIFDFYIRYKSSAEVTKVNSNALK